MRKPQIHLRLGVDNINGLSNLLTDETLDWRSLITPVANRSGWDLLTAGRTPPDPPRLLSSRRMAQLMQDITSNGGYDLVIVDTPPALGLADAALVAEHIDGLLMLVSLRLVPRNLPKLAIRRIRDAGAPVLGVITNSRQLRREGGDSPAYGYGGYGYGYGNASYGYHTYANDPLLAYRYYDKSTEPRQDKGPKGWKAAIPTPRNIQRNMRRFGAQVNNWLDE
jgi:Mrp family chromosome partitioning ATPase